LFYKAFVTKFSSQSLFMQACESSIETLCRKASILALSFNGVAVWKAFSNA